MTRSLPRIHPTVVHMFEEAVRLVPGREAIVCGSERLDYREYAAAVSALAHELIASGAAGERVALVMGNSADLCVAMFAVHAAGAQAVPLNPVYTARELTPMLADAGPCAVLYDAAVAAIVEPIAVSLGIPRRLCIGAGERRLVRHAAAAPSTLPRPLPRPEQLATLQYTGGTTGRSKGVNLAHRAVATNISQREGLVPARDGERILCVMPLFHVYAVAMCLHNAACCRGTLIVVPRYQPEAVFDLLERERVTAFAGSPTVFTSLMAHERFRSARFEGLRVSYSGSAPLPEALLRAWEEATGAPVVEGYGQTESGPVISFNPLQGVRKPRSVGVAVPGTEIEIVDAGTGTRVLAAGEVGEIRVRGPQLMSGYRNLPEETTQALRDGWLYTGDLGELDTEGYLYIRDRKKDMFLVSGYNVYPREIEEVLYLHPAVREAAVIGVPDEYRGSSVKAFVVLDAAAAAGVGAAELESHCRANLAPYKIPRSYELCAALPKTPVGKIDRRQLR